MKLSDGIETLKGIGTKKKEALNSNGIITVQDLIYLLPVSYEDRRSVYDIRSGVQDKPVLIEAHVKAVRGTYNIKRKRTPVVIIINDGKDDCEVLFFNSGYLKKLFKVGVKYSFFGKVTEQNGKFKILHPKFAVLNSKEDIRGIIPVYPSIKGISQPELRRLQKEISVIYDDMAEWIPENIVKEYRLSSIRYALENIHFAKDAKKTLAAKFRIVFEEFFALEIGLMYIRNNNLLSSKGASFSCDKGDEYAKNLPFKLTDDQLKAWADIKADISSDYRMNRLLQGDVGSGKTVIAQMAMLSAASCGWQSVIMAPTELLARQHLKNFAAGLNKYGIKVGLLVSAMKKSEKDKLISEIENGKVDIVIATHAVLQDNIKFNRLGLVITDEQHRFGVEQRKILSSKAEEANILVMTATPIPRTLAVIVYGDLDISQIKSLPKGRKPVHTTALNRDARNEAYDFMHEEIRKGRQAYIVAPLIEDSDSIDAISATSLYEEVRAKFRDFKVALLHGAMKQDYKDEVMKSFSNGEIDILVSTVVIEVGIDVSNATVMIIESAERFGLAQLHQLRGRVGRGIDASHCFLISDSGGDVSTSRIEIMCKSNDGFEIAEKDLDLRGPGEIFGHRQHGLPEIHSISLLKNIDVLEQATKAAKTTIKSDKSLSANENKGILEKVSDMFGNEVSIDL